MKTTKLTDTARIAVLCLIISLVLPLLFAAAPRAIAYAADSTVDFDSTDVMQDLQGSALNGVPFNVEDYPYNPNGSLQVLGFVEYCYSDYENLRGNYGLYLYVYNPALLDLATGTGSNKIQMANAYDVSGNPSDWTKFSLKFCSKSQGVTANRFWKFKVVDREIDGKTFAERVSPSERRYDISGVEFMVYGEATPKELAFSNTFRFTGFAEGYGSTGEPLNCTVGGLESIPLNVHHTSFLANISPLGKGHHNQVSSVYFAVPNRYFDTAGNLQKIKAEWYEYKLRNMLITSDKELYDLAQQYKGYELNGIQDDNVPFYIDYDYQETDIVFGKQLASAEWAFNQASYSNDWYSLTVRNNDNMLPLSFYSEVLDPYQIFKFLNKYFKPAGDVSSNELLEAMYGYSNNLGHGYIDPEDKKMSSDLFYNYVDEGRIRGYQEREVDFGDTFDMQSFGTTSTWIEKFIEFGWFSKPDFGEDYKDVRPIYDVQAADLSGSNEDISKRLLINEYDVPAFKEFYNENSGKNHIILFRFATTDYLSHTAGYGLRKSSGTEYTDDSKSKAYICSETVFLNFDIITLTFNRDGEYRAFAVVSDPIDIVGDLKPPAPPQIADDLEDAGQAIKDFFERVGDWFKSVGDWLKENWVWLVVGIVGGIIVITIIVALIKAAISRPKVNITMQQPKSSKPRRRQPRK